MRDPSGTRGTCPCPFPWRLRSVFVRRPGCCAGEGSAAAYKSSTAFPDETLTFIKTFPLMDESVPSVDDRPLFTRTTSRYAAGPLRGGPVSTGGSIRRASFPHGAEPRQLLCVGIRRMMGSDDSQRSSDQEFRVQSVCSQAEEEEGAARAVSAEGKWGH